MAKLTTYAETVHPGNFITDLYIKKKEMTGCIK